MNATRALFVASTGQHVGKTTSCLGLFRGLQRRFSSVGFMKPVGQQDVEAPTGVRVDKDVLLFHEHFHLQAPFEAMSPVLIPQGFTRDFLDGKITEQTLKQQIEKSFQQIASTHEFTLVEGTGHTAVGSIINCNNAAVASLLKLPMLLVARGGIGSAFDEIVLNKTLCESYGVRLLGVILNQVLPEKEEMVNDYMRKALARFNLPLLGSIPFDPFLSNPSMKDFEELFRTTLLTGQEHLLRHFIQIRLVAAPVEIYQEMIVPNQLIITPAHREDIILATLSRHWELQQKTPPEDLQAGMILTGDRPPPQAIVEQLRQAHLPMLYAPGTSYLVMKKILLSTSKIVKEDVDKIQEAIQLVEQHIDFNALLDALNKK